MTPWLFEMIAPECGRFSFRLIAYRKVATVPRSYGFLSTYPPTQCGLATFTRSLMRGIATEASGDRVGVVSVQDSPAGAEGPGVVGHLRTDVPGTHSSAAAALNTFDVAVVQHEYGIYGGPDGDQLLAVLDEITVPVVVVAHTVLSAPTPRQALILQQVIRASDAVVAMTDAARDRLVSIYGVAPDKVTVIRHGAVARADAGTAAAGTDPLILTWGLLGPGKGIEWAIDGLRALQRLRPLPTYIVAGQTHPRVLLHEGEAYRDRLQRRAEDTGVAGMLRFEGSYLDDDALAKLISRADIVLLPYDSREQVTSGVLVEAVAAGKPVVATAFPHAVELLSSGAGLVVPQGDGDAIGAALHRVLTEPGMASGMRAEAARIAPSLDWPAVAAQYRGLATGLLAAHTPHLDVHPTGRANHAEILGVTHCPTISQRVPVTA
jgi:polysaccharide biosynthesis protein PslF